VAGDAIAFDVARVDFRRFVELRENALGASQPLLDRLADF
jgi:hypothetical protein